MTLSGAMNEFCYFPFPISMHQFFMLILQTWESMWADFFFDNLPSQKQTILPNKRKLQRPLNEPLLGGKYILPKKDDLINIWV
jgi:hypothetical protein